MIIFKYKKIEEVLWFTLLILQIVNYLYFTPLQSLRYYTQLVYIVDVLSWPISILLLFYILKGRLRNQDKQGKLLMFTILGILFGILSNFTLLFIILSIVPLIFFLIVLVISGFKLLREPKTTLI